MVGPGSVGAREGRGKGGCSLVSGLQARAQAVALGTHGGQLLLDQRARALELLMAKHQAVHPFGEVLQRGHVKRSRAL